MVPFVMMSVLVGAIIDSLSAAREELVKEATGQVDPLEVLCQNRIEATIGPSGKSYGQVWELGDIPLYGDIRYDAALIEAWIKPLADSEENWTLRGEISSMELKIEKLERKLERRALLKSPKKSMKSPKSRGFGSSQNVLSEDPGDSVVAGEPAK